MNPLHSDFVFSIRVLYIYTILTIYFYYRHIYKSIPEHMVIGCKRKGSDIWSVDIIFVQFNIVRWWTIFICLLCLYSCHNFSSEKQDVKLSMFAVLRVVRFSVVFF